MDTNNWRPTSQGGEPVMGTGDWRTQLQPDSRQRIVNKIMDTLKRHLPFSGQEGLNELKKIAGRFEEMIYTAATSQSDYLRKISLKMLSMESKSENAIPNSLPSNGAGNSNKPRDPGSGLQNQVNSQGQPLPIPLANQSQSCQQLLSQSLAGVTGSSGLPSTLPPVSSLTQAPISNVVGPNSTMQNMPGGSQNTVGNSMGQAVSSNFFATFQRQMPTRQQVLPQQQQRQSQSPQPFMYQQQQLQQQYLKQKMLGNLSHTLTQLHMQQQPNLLQPNQLQSSPPTMMHPAPISSLEQNQQPQHSSQSMIQQHAQSVLTPQQQQSTGIHQQQTPMSQQSMMPPQQQLMGQPSNASNMQQNQLIGQQNSVGDIQLQQQQRLLGLGQQSNLTNLQQQQLMAQQNLSSIQHQQMGPQSNISLQAQQQQQLLGTQSVNSSMQTNQHSVHMLQQSRVQLQQQTQQSASLLPNQGQSQPQQQLMSQMQSQPAQLQQQLGLQQQPNPLQRDMQQRLQPLSQASGSLLQPQNVMDQQKQLYQSQRVLPETSTTSLDSTAPTELGNGDNWEEEVYQKIKTMKEMYLPELNEMYQKIATKLQHHDSLPHQPKSDQLEKLKIFKTMLERIIAFLQVSKISIPLGFKEKLSSYEMLIIKFINTNRPRKPVSSLQQEQLLTSHMHSMQQQPQPQNQVHSHDNQMNPQMQSMNIQNSVATMPQNNVTSLQHNSMPSVPGVSQQNMLNSLPQGSNLDLGQGNAMNSLHHVTVGFLQQNTVSGPQQANINPLSSQSGVNMLQSNMNPLQSSSSMLHNQHLKQQQEQILQTQQLKQHIQRRQMQHLMMQKQQQQQQQQQMQQQAKPLLPAQLQTHQMPQVHQMNDVNDLKMRPGINNGEGVFQQHLASGQRSAYPYQQLKPGATFPISSPPILQAASPQMPQHSSPQVDQQNLLSSLTKTETPLQSAANSPFVVPSPSTPLAPSSILGDNDKPISGISSLSNAGNIGHQQTSNSQAAVPSLATGAPGISASLHFFLFCFWLIVSFILLLKIFKI